MASSTHSHRQPSAGRRCGVSEDSPVGETTSRSVRRFHCVRSVRPRSFRPIDWNKVRIGVRKIGPLREPGRARDLHPHPHPHPSVPVSGLLKPARQPAFPWIEVQTGQNQIVIFLCVWYRFHLRHLAAWRSRRCSFADGFFASPFAPFTSHSIVDG